MNILFWVCFGSLWKCLRDHSWPSSFTCSLTSCTNGFRHDPWDVHLAFSMAADGTMILAASLVLHSRSFLLTARTVLREPWEKGPRWRVPSIYIYCILHIIYIHCIILYILYILHILHIIYYIFYIYYIRNIHCIRISKDVCPRFADDMEICFHYHHPEGGLYMVGMILGHHGCFWVNLCQRVASWTQRWGRHSSLFKHHLFDCWDKLRDLTYRQQSGGAQNSQQRWGVTWSTS